MPASSAAGSGRAAVHLQLGRVLARRTRRTMPSRKCRRAETGPADRRAARTGIFCQRGEKDLAEAAYRPLSAHPNDAEFHRGLGRRCCGRKSFRKRKGTSGGGAIEAGLAEVYVDLAFAASENKNYDLTIRALNGAPAQCGNAGRCIFFAPPRMTTCATTTGCRGLSSVPEFRQGKNPIRSGKRLTA